MMSVQKTLHSAGLAYRPDIDGLRALAVLSVVIFHAFPRWLSGGFVGVDIFFVISGFLISSIIFKEIDAGKFTFGGFYARRAKRIFPALLIVLLTVALAGWYVLTPDEFAQLGKHCAAGAGFVANFALWSEAGYFDTASDTKPLLHLWSLGIEEQFYIVWPIALVAIRKLKVNRFNLCVGLALASFALNVIFIGKHADGVFYLPVTRFWEMLAGAALAEAMLRRTAYSDKGASPIDHVLSVTGIAILMAALLTIDESVAFPGWWALMPVFGAVLLIGAGPSNLVNRYLLANPLMRRIGIISYPAYLWHWPLLSFGKILFGNLSKEMRLGLIVTAFILAQATYSLIEKRVRFGARAGKAGNTAPTRLAGRLYGALVLACACGLAMAMGGLPSRSHSADLDTLLAAQYDWAFPPRSFAKLSQGMANFYTRRTANPDYTVFIGDSIIEQYAPRVELLLDGPKGAAYQSVVFATGPACPPIPGVFHRSAHAHPTCAGTTTAGYALAHAPQVKTVVIGGNLDNYLSGQNSELVYREGSRTLPYSDPAAVDAAFAALEKEIASLAPYKRVYIVLNSPKGAFFSPKRMLTGSRFTTLSRQPASTSVSIQPFIDAYGPIRGRLIAMARRHSASVIDPIAVLCNGAICPTVAANGNPLFMDDEHMRPFYVREHATYIDQLIEGRARTFPVAAALPAGMGE